MSEEHKEVQAADYESPAIEEVITPETLEREAHYAGTPPTHP